MRSGELFAGVGGLGMAVDEVFGSSPGWFCEFDAAPSKVLAHRYPDVPNIGDVRTADWASLEPVQILAGGFPCQDVSLAGARRGMKEGTRSGLWSEFARAIDTIRPDWVVIENVRGLLSADAAGDVEPCPWCLGDDGEQHALRALGAVLGDLAELGFDAEWTGLRAADIGAPHGRFRVFILAWPAAYTDGGRREVRQEFDGDSAQDPTDRGPRGEYVARRTGPEIALLPTPSANPFEGEPEPFLARQKRMKALGINGNGAGIPLAIAVRLLPTPRTTDMNGAGTHGAGGPDLRTVAVETLEPVLSPSTAMGFIDWGEFTAAVERWARAIGRNAPSPVRHDGKGGKARLNPELPEWMMGWPAGWVTDPAIGLTRAEQLKCAGNGVVSQQAAFALREMLTRPGVPAIRQGVSA